MYKRIAQLLTKAEVSESLSLLESEFDLLIDNLKIVSIVIDKIEYWDALNCINSIVKSEQYFIGGPYLNKTYSPFIEASLTQSSRHADNKMAKVLVPPENYSEYSAQFKYWLEAKKMPQFLIFGKVLVCPEICNSMYSYPYFGR